MNTERAPSTKSAGKAAPLQRAGGIDWTGVDARRVEYSAAATVFSQGDAASTVLYIERGTVRLSVLSHTGKEAVVGLLHPGDFFGEGCLAGQARRAATATTMTAAAIVAASRQAIERALPTSSAFAEGFLAYLLRRNIRIEEDLVDQLFNSCEKRLARVLLLLARYDNDERTRRTIPRMSQELLAEMVGTTRTRVNCFMNKFRSAGYIDYRGGSDVTINPSLFRVVLTD